MPSHPGNLSKADIYQQVIHDPVWRADNFVFMIVRRLVKDNRVTRRHGMALWNLYQLDKETYSRERMFHNADSVEGAYPALSEAEACAAMDERGYVWIDPYFEGGEYFGQGASDRWELKSEMWK